MLKRDVSPTMLYFNTTAIIMLIQALCKIDVIWKTDKFVHGCHIENFDKFVQRSLKNSTKLEECVDFANIKMVLKVLPVYY